MNERGATPKSTPRPDRFEWSGGHPALDLVNTVDDRPSSVPVERLANYAELLAFAVAAGIISPALGSRLRSGDDSGNLRILRRVRALREHLHCLLSAAHSRHAARQVDVDAISTAIRAAHAARTLTFSAARTIADHGWASTAGAAIPLHACALSVEDLLVHQERGRIRKCGARDCDVYFFDRSKGHVRRWCSMGGCGNREKQRRRSAR
jgi:predicted RNA-binding Zn ribbon-like protein